MAHASHEHHGHHVEGTGQPLFWAALIIFGFCAFAYAAARAGLAAQGAAAAGSPAAADTPATVPMQGTAGPRDVPPDKARRIEFVRTFEARQRAIGYEFRATAQGGASDVFEVRWDQRGNQEKIRQLQTAEPLHREARTLGFRKMRIVVGDRTIWEKDLR